MLQLKLFGDYRYQIIEEKFNGWANEVRPFIIKSILTTQAVPKQEGGNSLYFALAVFFNVDAKPYESEVPYRPNSKPAGGPQ
jgi:hypothetical protein